jgi:hypothetical protein
LNNRNNNPIFTEWFTPVAIFGAFLFTIFGTYSITDYISPDIGFQREPVVRISYPSGVIIEFFAKVEIESIKKLF